MPAGPLGETRLHRLEVSFNSSSPVIREMLTAINELPEWSIERAEAEWFLYCTLAKVAARRADRLRDQERATERRRAARGSA